MKQVHELITKQHVKCIEPPWDLICLLQIFKSDKPFGTICNSSDHLAEPWQSCGWVKSCIRRHSKPWLAFIWRVHISMRRSIERKLCSSRIKLALIWSNSTWWFGCVMYPAFIKNLDFGMQTLVTRLILVCNWNAFLRLQNGLSTWFWTAWSIAVYCEAQIPRPDISFATCHHPAASCWQPSATLPSALAPLRSLSLCSTAPFCNLYKKILLFEA